jgi:hypothetical protein
LEIKAIVVSEDGKKMLVLASSLVYLVSPRTGAILHVLNELNSRDVRGAWFYRRGVVLAQDSTVWNEGMSLHVYQFI